MLHTPLQRFIYRDAISGAKAQQRKATKGCCRHLPVLSQDSWGSSSPKKLSCHSLKLPTCGQEIQISGRSGPVLCVPRPRDPHIVELTTPRRQRGHYIMPIRCFPRPVWCLQMRIWDPDWTHHLQRPNRQKCWVRELCRGHVVSSRMSLEQNTVTNKNTGVKSFHCDKLNAPTEPPMHSPDFPGAWSSGKVSMTLP